MEIEIVTTKKKLTKSLLAQMPTTLVDIMKVAKVLGYYNDPKEGKLALLNHNQEYYTRLLVYQISEKVLDKIFQGGRQAISFDTKQDRDDWWDAYTKVREEALKTHIYI